MPEAPLDVLAQQIAAEVNAQEWDEAELYALIRRAWPYRNLAAEDFQFGFAHARGGLHHAARAAWRADPSR